MFSVASRRVLKTAASTSIHGGRNGVASFLAARCMSSIPSTMKAAVVREVGDAHALKVENDFPTPEIKPGGVIVKNQYAGINFIDTYHRKAYTPEISPSLEGKRVEEQWQLYQMKPPNRGSKLVTQ